MRHKRLYEGGVKPLESERLKRESEGIGRNKMRFVADSMLGKLAKWLRILGYDTHYQSYYRPGAMEKLVSQGRTLLSRQARTVELYESAVLIRGNDVGEQLAELRTQRRLAPEKSRWFSRCLTCNVLLEAARTEEARENIPEYVFYENEAAIRYCPSCQKYYWPGTHRQRMLKQLETWGFMS